MRRTLALVVSSCLLAARPASPQAAPQDEAWPQWLGPSRDGRSSASGVFPAAGPVRLREAWRRPLGPATSGLSVAGDRLVTLESDAQGVHAVALSARDGSVLWRTALDALVTDEERGPASTPAVADGLAFVLSPACQLRALELASGSVAWHVDLKAQFGSSPRLGCTSSPLVDGERVIVQTGAPDEKRLVALDRRSGLLAWAAKGVARANYSAPGLRRAGAGREVLVHHTDVSQGDPRGGVSAFRAEDGALAWHHTLDRYWSWATPVPVGDDAVLVLTWNDAALVRVPAGSQAPTVAWRSPAFTAFVGMPVVRDGHLYGHGGDFLRCVRASDGQTVWEERTYPGSVTLVDGHLVALSISAGLLRVVEATPQAYRERARLAVFEPGSRAETPPSVVGRRIFVRNDETVVAVDVEGGAAAKAAELAGAWAGEVEHDGERTPFALELEPGDDGRLLLKATVPAAHLSRAALGRVTPQVEGDTVKLGPFAFTHDAAAKTLTGVVPEGFAPVYRLPLRLVRVDKLEVPERAEPGGERREPAWTYDAGAPLWAGPTFAGGLVYAGGEDGQLHAVDARSGAKRWSFRAGGAFRTRAAVAGGRAFIQADDGFLYALDAATGREAWRSRVTDKPIERLPFDNPKSRYDRFGSDAFVAGGRLYVGTHDGRVLALDAASGARLWEFATGDSVLAAPALAAGRLYVGSYDKHVYALDAASGRLLWKRDTQGAVVSTPAVAGDLVIVGNRCYDLLGLRAATGEVAWKRYVWFSWIESSAVVRDGVLYVGSSDAAAAFAFDAASGRPRWQADVFGWAWGQPAVTRAAVYVGTSSQAGYPSGHRAGVVALDRASGSTRWRFDAPAAEKGAFGFPGSPATGGGFVFVSGLDGRVYAFAL